MNAKKTVSMKAVVILMSVVLMIGCAVGGTLAWLIADSKTVTNTFVAGAIGTLDLTETDADKQFTIVPGVDIEKDPTVVFSGNNIPAFVFVKVTAADNTWTASSDGKSYTLTGTEGKMEWTVADGWTAVSGKSGVYYRVVDADNDATIAEDEKYPVIKDNKITVSSTITKNTIENFKKDLTFTAYAIQQEGHEGADEAAKAAAAWAALNP